MHTSLPPWVDLSVEHPPRLPGDAGTGRVVALLATTKAQTAGWTAAGAVALARAWRAQGRRIVLVDAGVASPSLHSALDVANGEGLSDVVLFGASPGRVTTPLEDGLLFVPAGTLTADVPAVFYSERWDRLVRSFRQAAATLVLFVPADEPTIGQVLSVADDLIVLGSVGEDVLGWVDDAEKVRALLSAPSPVSSPEAADLADPLDPLAVDPLGVPDAVETTREADSETDPMAADIGDPTPTGPDSVDPGGAVLPATPVPDSTDATPEPAKDRRFGMAALVVLILAVAGLRFGLLPVPGFPRGEAPAVEEAQAGAPTPPVQEVAPPAEPRITSSPTPFSLTLASFRDPEAARASLETLTPRIAGTLLQITPVVVNGTSYHRLLLGATADSLAALDLAKRIAEAISADESTWVIRRTPLAYLLEETDSLGEARNRVAAAWEASVPAYVLQVTYDDGRTMYRVYAGAYADQEEAGHLGEILAAAGDAAELVERVGQEPGT